MLQLILQIVSARFYQNCHILSTVGWPSLSDRHVVSIVGTNSCWTKTSQSLWHGLHRKLPRKGEPPSISAGNGHICDFTAMWQIHTNDYWQTTSGASPLTGGFTLTQQVAKKSRYFPTDELRLAITDTRLHIARARSPKPMSLRGLLLGTAPWGVLAASGCWAIPASSVAELVYNHHWPIVISCYIPYKPKRSPDLSKWCSPLGRLVGL